MYNTEWAAFTAQTILQRSFSQQQNKKNKKKNYFTAYSPKKQLQYYIYETKKHKPLLSFTL